MCWSTTGIGLIDTCSKNSMLFHFAPASQGQTICHFVEPASQRLTLVDGSRSPGQHEEGGLESVFCIMLIADYFSADAQHHGTMPMHQQFKGGFVTFSLESKQEVSILDRVRLRRAISKSKDTM